MLVLNAADQNHAQDLMSLFSYLISANVFRKTNKIPGWRLIRGKVTKC